MSMNVATVNTDQALNALKLGYALNQPAFMWGPPGIGKSELARQFARQVARKPDNLSTRGEELWTRIFGDSDCGLIDLRLGQYDSVDLRGLPDVTNGMTTWAVPSTLPFEGSEFEELLAHLPDNFRFVLFLDEAMQAMPAVQGVAFQLVLEGRVGEHRLLPGTYIVGASNRETDKAGVNKMQTPLANRFWHMEMQAALEPWVEWARSNGVPQPVYEYVRFREEHLDTFDEAVKVGAKAFATPRSWAAVGGVMALFEDPDNPGTFPGLDRGRPLIDGRIGPGLGAELMAFAEVWESMPSIDGILKDPDNAVVPDKPDMLFAVTASIAEKVTTKTLGNALKYAERLPKARLVSMVRDIAHRNPELLGRPEMTKFYSDYQELILG